LPEKNYFESIVRKVWKYILC